MTQRIVQTEVFTEEKPLYTAPAGVRGISFIRAGNDTGAAITVHLRLVSPDEVDDPTRVVKVWPAIQVDASGGVVDDDTWWPMQEGWQLSGYASAVGLALILVEVSIP